MRDIYTQYQLFESWKSKYVQNLYNNGLDRDWIGAIKQYLREGLKFANQFPNWIPYIKQQPQNGDKVLAFLDDDTMQTYTYYDNNKELVQLFKNHVIAWMYQPNKPIFKIARDEYGSLYF